MPEEALTSVTVSGAYR